MITISPHDIIAMYSYTKPKVTEMHMDEYDMLLEVNMLPI